MAEKRASALYVYATSFGAAALIVYGVTAGAWSQWQPTFRPGSVVFWLVACAASNLLPASVTSDVEATMSGPVNLAIAYLFPAPVAAAIVAFGSLTDWEIQRDISVPRAAFNRAQLALATGAASSMFQVASLGPWRVVSAIVIYNLLNLFFVMEAQHLLHGVRLSEVFHRVVTPVPSFIGSYLVLGCLGIIFALVYKQLGGFEIGRASCRERVEK